MTRSTSLPASAQECAASASIDADPVTTAATDLARARTTLTTRATSTVTALSERPAAVAPATGRDPLISGLLVEVPAVGLDDPADGGRSPGSGPVGLDRRRVGQQGRGELPQPLDPGGSGEERWVAQHGVQD